MKSHPWWHWFWVRKKYDHEANMYFGPHAMRIKIVQYCSLCKHTEFVSYV